MCTGSCCSAGSCWDCAVSSGAGVEFRPQKQGTAAGTDRCLQHGTHTGIEDTLSTHRIPHTTHTQGKHTHPCLAIKIGIYHRLLSTVFMLSYLELYYYRSIII